MFALAESHISIHTWPEFGYVSIDVFVCNQSGDNSSKAERICESLIDIFHSQKQNLQTIHRSMVTHP
ncbi:S-adenosylmethionine decarboxylase [Candidatus Peregrinibacteria bacterium]|nr:S-adenosylmethionine decarboxylase [Candidatus Peregrinibacteria bacterium]MCB9804753.1 S-adenosylmethionine decarboxylase [Candidatus Peribacteria bacterium]